MKKVIVYGLGLSGEAMFNLLKNECGVMLFDDGKNLPGWAPENAVLNSLDDALDQLSNLDALLLSPSVSLDRPLVKACCERKIPVVGELELGFLRSRCKIVAITGTNGKTTTVSLINHILRQSGKNSFALGNIGVPICSLCDELKEDDIAVLEASSFQLESCTRFAPYISAILNITPDHLDRHSDFKNYVSAKANIFAFQRDGYCIFNADDPVVKAIEWRTKSKKLFFSTEKRTEGCYLENGKIVLNIKKSKATILDVSGLKIKGIHNVQNAMCAVLACYALGLDTDEIRRGMFGFNGVEHRLEFVDSLKGVDFINDSKSTNIDSTVKAVGSFTKKTLLILGGRDKNLDFEELFAKMPSRVKRVAVIGESAEKILKAAEKKGYKKCVPAKDLEHAVKLLFAEAKHGELILLSPACASFDRYKDFCQRGEHFKKIVEEIKNEIV